MTAVCVWAGRAGSGKSSRIAAEIRDTLQENPFGPKVFWIVPSDASYATERLLMREVKASIRCEVVTIQRLAERIRQSLYAAGDAVPVNTTGRRLALANVYQSEFDNLQVLRREYPSIAFLDAILQVFDEMSAYNVPLDQVETALEAAATQLSGMHDGLPLLSGRSLLGKLRDLCLLYVRWRRLLEVGGLYNPADVACQVAPRVGEWAELAGAVVYVDGFDDIVPRDLEFLAGIAAHASRIVFTLGIDANWLHGMGQEAPLSSSADPDSVPDIEPDLQAILDGMVSPGVVHAPQTVQLLTRLRATCRRHELAFHFEAVEPVSNIRTPALQALESGAFGHAPDKHPRADGIFWIGAQNIRTEASGVAQEVSRLVHGEGYRFGDIAILVPDVAEYAPHLRERLEKQGIPAYLEDFPAFAAHPLAKFVLAAVQAAEDRFATDSMVRLLKSDFCGLEREAADWLETYLHQHEVAGFRPWHQWDAWAYAEASEASAMHMTRARREDERADGLRRIVAAYMMPLADALAGETCVPRTFADALWTLMETVGAKRIVARWMVNDDAELSPLEASMHEQAWQRMMALLSDLADANGTDPVPRAFLLQVMKSDIASQSLASIPAGTDEVLVTDISRARAFTSRVVFLMGAVDGVFPRRVHEQGLLSDEERVQFRRLFGSSVGLTTEERQLCERTTVYHGLTRATDCLYLTYPLSNADGKELRPSSLLARTQELYGDVEASRRLWMDGSVAGNPGVLTARTAMEYSVRSLREMLDGNPGHPQLVQVLQWFSLHEDWQSAFWQAMRGLVHETHAGPVAPQVAQRLFGQPLHMNVYQLESYAACPYQHFAKFGLRLSEDVRPDVTAAMRGTLLHDALLGFVQRHMSDMVGWRLMTDEEAIHSVQSVFEETLNSPQSAGWSKKAIRRQQAMEVLSVLENAAVVLTRHVRHGKFAPVAMEMSFGLDDADSLPGFEVAVDDDLKVILRGRIDRIDVAGDGDERAFRIIDYKSSQMDIDLTKVHHGLRLQLPIYATVVKHMSGRLFGGRATPAALLYIPVIRRPSSRLTPSPDEDARVESLKRMRARGILVNREDFVEWMDDRLTAGEDSELFPKIYKKDMTLMKHAPTLEADEWQLLMDKALSHVRRIAGEVMNGQIDISPYWLNSQDYACRHCSFAALCQVDTRWHGGVFRPLPKWSKDQLREQWANSSVREVDR